MLQSPVQQFSPDTCPTCHSLMGCDSIFEQELTCEVKPLRKDMLHDCFTCQTLLS